MNYNNFDKINHVKALVDQNGGWESVLSNYHGLAQSFEKGTRQQPCPLTGGGRTKFRWFRDYRETGGAYHNDVGPLPDGIAVVTWYVGCSISQALDEIIRICGGDLSRVTESDAAKAKRKHSQQSAYKTSEEALAKAKKVLRNNKAQAKPILNTHAQDYLRKRGICCDLGHMSDLGFHPKLAYKESDETDWQHFPGMLAMVRDVNGKPVTMHRTFLNTKQPVKADVMRSKMIFAPIADVRGCSIQLDQPKDVGFGEKVIGIAEGIENALSVREATGTPMWVGISDRLMEAVKFPDDVTFVLIWADIEPSGAGLAAAKRLKERLEKEGRNAEIFIPNCPKGVEKIDWNDVYQSQGISGFPPALRPEYQLHTGVEIHD